MESSRLVPSVIASGPDAVILKLSKPPVHRKQAVRALVGTTCVVVLLLLLAFRFLRPFGTVLGFVAVGTGLLALVAHFLLVETTFVATSDTGQLVVERRALASRRKSRSVLCGIADVASVDVAESVFEDDIQPALVYQLSVTTHSGRKLPIWWSSDELSVQHVAASLKNLCHV